MCFDPSLVTLSNHESSYSGKGTSWAGLAEPHWTWRAQDGTCYKELMWGCCVLNCTFVGVGFSWWSKQQWIWCQASLPKSHTWVLPAYPANTQLILMSYHHEYHDLIPQGSHSSKKCADTPPKHNILVLLMPYLCFIVSHFAIFVCTTVF